jgi:4-carboxymuconolactone decarboxylase
VERRDGLFRRAEGARDPDDAVAEDAAQPEEVPGKPARRLSSSSGMRDNWATTTSGDATMSDAPKFGRYAEIPVDQMTPAQREGYRFLVEGPRGRLPGPYKVWVHNPRLVHAAAPLGQHFTPGQSSLSEREREIAVLVITSAWHAAYPTAAHEKRGKEVGLPAAAVEAIIARLPTSFADAREQTVYEVAMALAGGHLVPDGLYDRAVAVLGHESVTDMIVLMGYYTAVSLTMNFYAVPAGSPGLAR